MSLIKNILAFCDCTVYSIVVDVAATGSTRGEEKDGELHTNSLNASAQH